MSGKRKALLKPINPAPSKRGPSTKEYSVNDAVSMVSRIKRKECSKFAIFVLHSMNSVVEFLMRWFSFLLTFLLLFFSKILDQKPLILDEAIWACGGKCAARGWVMLALCHERNSNRLQLMKQSLRWLHRIE